MLQPEVVYQLNMIAYEGWEYYKLSSDTLYLVSSGQSNRDSKAMTNVRFQNQAEETGLDQIRIDTPAIPIYIAQELRS
jgi:hypothetical protein